MNSSSSSLYLGPPERLESRVAPAGLVTATFLNGLLTITGSDGADHDVDIIKTGLNKFQVVGIATDINTTGQSSQTFKGDLRNVQIEGGTGGDRYELINLRPLKSFGFDGGAGVDELSATNFKTKLKGRVDISLGSETGSVALDGPMTKIRGHLNIDLGGGGTVTFGSALTVVTGPTEFTGGIGNDSVSITGAAASFKRTFIFNAGDGNDSFNATGQSLKFKGAVTMDGGAGTDSCDFAADNNLFGTILAPALVDLKLGIGPGAVTFEGNRTNVWGDLKIDLGTGGGAAELTSATNTLHRSLEVNGGAGNDTLEFTGRTSIGKSLSFNGDLGDDSLLASGALFAVKGAASMDAGSGAEASVFDLDVVSLQLAGLTITGGASNDTVRINADGAITGNVNVQLGGDGIGPSSTILQSRTATANGLRFGGTLTINMTGTTVDVLTIANIQVEKEFSAQTGENVSTVTISQLNARNNVSLLTGSGADVVAIDNFKSKDLFVDTGIGADILWIERSALLAGTSEVRGIATILTGIGADNIRIGDSSNAAAMKVFFRGAMTLDAGDGANTRNDIVGSNFFQVPPTIIATGGTLTQTA